MTNNDIFNIRNAGCPTANGFPLDCKIMAEEDEEELSTHFLWLIADNSLSIRPKAAAVYEQLQSSLSGLAKANDESIDMRVRVKLALFNSDIKSFNDVHLDPQQLADTFTAEDFRCTGSTNGGAVFRYMDAELSRNSPAIRSLKKNGPGLTFVIITDAEVNDSVGLRQEARKILDSNRFYQDYARTLVVFLGNDKHKATAVAMANGVEKNVVALEDDLVSMLAPIIVNSTVTFTDGSHINSTGESDLGKIAEDARKRDEEGTRSADDLTDDQLRDELIRLMGKAS